MLILRGLESDVDFSQELFDVICRLLLILTCLFLQFVVSPNHLFLQTPVVSNSYVNSCHSIKASQCFKRFNAFYF